MFKFFEKKPRVPIVQTDSDETVPCPCGCEQTFRIFGGLVNFENGPSVPYLVGLLRCASGGPNMWIMLRLSPLPDEPVRDCWVAMHLWDDGENIVTNIIDAADAPVVAARHLEDRLLSRESALAQPGFKDFAIHARLRLVDNHPELRTFF